MEASLFPRSATVPQDVVGLQAGKFTLQCENAGAFNIQALWFRPPSQQKFRSQNVLVQIEDNSYPMQSCGDWLIA